MARIRTIKPEFFTSDTLAEASRDARLLFVGLWTMADREGRLDDRPKRIKATLFPYDDDADIEMWLNELTTLGHIVRYENNGKRIVIPGFLEHQRPHPKEPLSNIPPPEAVEKNGEPWKETAENVSPGSIPSSPVGREGKGKEGKEVSLHIDFSAPDVLTAQGIVTALTVAVNKHQPQAGLYNPGRFHDRELRMLLDAIPLTQRTEAARTDILRRIEAFAKTRDSFVESRGWSVQAFVDRWNDPDGSKRTANRFEPPLPARAPAYRDLTTD